MNGTTPNATKFLALWMFIGACGTVLPASAEPAPQQTCASLTKLFDEADKSAVPADKLAAAQKERRHGRGMCGTGNTAAGMRALKKALELVGVKVD